MMIRPVLFTVLILFLGTSSQTWAFLGPDLSLGVRAGLSTFQGDDVFGADADFDTASTLGLTFGIRQGRLGGELSVDWMETDLETDINEGELTIVSLLLTAQYHLLRKVPVVDPYIGLGVGYHLNSFDTSSESKALAAADGINNFDVETDNIVGFHINGGTNIKLTTALPFTIDARYVFSKPDIAQTGNISGGPFPLNDELKTNAFVITGGLKYIFSL